MRDRPDKVDLLQAVAHFLEREVRPALAGERGAARDDGALSFRVLIAAHLAGLVAAELRAEDDLDEAEAARLQELLPGFEAGAAARSTRRAERRDAVRRYNRELVARLRSGRLDESERRRIWEHVRATLREELAVTNPRFDTAADIE